MERTRSVIDQEYSNLAFLVGHKHRIVSQVQDEIKEDLEKLKKLNLESLALEEKEKAAKNDAQASDIRSVDAEVVA